MTTKNRRPLATILLTMDSLLGSGMRTRSTTCAYWKFQYRAGVPATLQPSASGRPDGLPTSIRERAFSSPIWYRP